MVRRSRACRSSLLLVLCLSACGDSPTGPRESLPVTRIQQGFFSAAPSRERLVIRSQSRLAQVWPVINPGSPLSLPPPPPTIDFSKEMVIVAFAGAKPSGGFCVTVEAAAGDTKTIEVTVRSVGPIPENTILPVVTHPFDVVRVPRRDDVEFIERSEIGNCGPLT